MLDWTYKGEIFTPPDPNKYEGFIYLIENLSNGKLYIGKKHFWTRQKDKKTKRKMKKESDWRNYYSSSDDLKKDVQLLGKEHFKRTILYLCIYKKQMTYLEQKEQWDKNVLLDENYYNTNIGGKFFIREKNIYEAKDRAITTKNDNWRKIKSESMKGENNIAKRDDVRKKLSEKKKGENHHQYGKTISEDHKKKLHDSCMLAVVQKWEVTTPLGEILQISNLNEFCRDHSLNAGAMCWVAKGKATQHKRYTCRKLTT
jgi:hypothetical protein